MEELPVIANASSSVVISVKITVLGSVTRGSVSVTVTCCWSLEWSSEIGPTGRKAASSWDFPPIAAVRRRELWTICMSANKVRRSRLSIFGRLVFRRLGCLVPLADTSANVMYIIVVLS